MPYRETLTGSCMLCGKTSKLDVDHCHTTLMVRGHLCRGCNTGIGLLGDTPEGVLRAVEYLLNPPIQGEKWIARGYVKEKHTEAARRYRAKHPEKAREASRRYYAKKKLERSGLT